MEERFQTGGAAVGRPGTCGLLRVASDAKVRPWACPFANPARQRAIAGHHRRRIFPIALPFASSSTSLSM